MQSQVVSLLEKGLDRLASISLAFALNIDDALQGFAGIPCPVNPALAMLVNPTKRVRLLEHAQTESGQSSLTRINALLPVTRSTQLHSVNITSVPASAAKQSSRY
jgi:hypothetical protein